MVGGGRGWGPFWISWLLSEWWVVVDHTVMKLADTF